MQVAKSPTAKTVSPDLRVAVGFGIGTPARAAAAARSADGVVVGSALMDALAKGGVAEMERLTRALAAAVHG